jgi:hypothetical protein
MEKIRIHITRNLQAVEGKNNRKELSRQKKTLYKGSEPEFLKILRSQRNYSKKAIPPAYEA